MLVKRPRRLRTKPEIRELVAETKLTTNDFVAPIFVVEGANQKIEIKSMPDYYRLSVDKVLFEIEELANLGIKSVALFPAVSDQLKNKQATESYNPDSLNQKAIREIKKRFPHLLLMGDIALDPYNSDGHDGLVDSLTGEIKNDETLEVLGKMCLAQARAGVDIIGPSDMMDGRVGYLRKVLDEENFKNVLIMSYTAKYASSFYGPFRDALDSAPKAGDKKTYQMDYRNSLEALKEAELDEAEGADILMVKPGLSYLDIIYRLKEQSTLPIAAYNVSGEYAMIRAAGINGWINENDCILETLTAFKRAGADIILTYFAKKAGMLLK
jgi:porphobilinogen synthase